MLPSNGEAEGPRDHASQRPRARNIDWAPRPQTTGASRPPPTIVSSHDEALPTSRATATLTTAGPMTNQTRTIRPEMKPCSNPVNHPRTDETAEKPTPVEKA